MPDRDKVTPASSGVAFPFAFSSGRLCIYFSSVDRSVVPSARSSGAASFSSAFAAAASMPARSYTACVRSAVYRLDFSAMMSFSAEACFS